MKQGAFEFQPQRLIDALLVRNVTKKELARVIGVTPQAITRFTKGQASPSNETVNKIVETLRFPEHYFFTPIPEHVMKLRESMAIYCRTHGSNKRCGVSTDR